MVKAIIRKLLKDTGKRPPRRKFQRYASKFTICQRRKRFQAEAERDAKGVAERGRVDAFRATHGLAPLTADRVNLAGHPYSRSRAGICVKCECEMVVNADQHHACLFCKYGVSEKAAAKRHEREAQAEATLNAPIASHEFQFQDAPVRVGSTLRDADFFALPATGIRPSRLKARQQRCTRNSLV